MPPTPPPPWPAPRILGWATTTGLSAEICKILNPISTTLWIDALGTTESTDRLEPMSRIAVS